MARLNYVKKAEQRFETVPVIDPATGEQTIRTLHRKDGEPKRNKRGEPVTQRVTRADRTKPLPNRKCGKCGAEIEPGMPYRWWANKLPGSRGGGSKKIRCMKAGCAPTIADMTPGRRGQLYGIQADLEASISGITTVDDFEGVRDECASAIRDFGQEFTEGADNMEQGFGHETEQSNEMREKGEALEQLADDIEQLDADEAPTEDDIEDAEIEAWQEANHDGEGSENEARADLLEEKVNEYLAEKRDELTEKVNEAEC